MIKTYSILFKRNFAPLFIVQFGGALNDNVLRNAIVAMITFGVLSQKIENNAIYVQMALGFFMLPFFLFSASAGKFADLCPDRSIAIRYIKLAEIFTMTVACIGLVSNNILLLIFSVFLAGMQSAYFGPFKYALLPIILKPHEIITGNALLNASTYIAIILGVYWGTILGAKVDSNIQIMIVLIIIAILGFIAAIKIPAILNDTNLSWQESFSMNIFNDIKSTIQKSNETPGLRNLILLISWFWASGAVITTQLPIIVSELLNYNENAYLFLLLIVCLGIATGSLSSSLVLKGKVSTKLVPIAIAVASFGCLLPVFAVSGEVVEVATKDTLTNFLNNCSSYYLIFTLFGISAAMGFYIVPLYATLQLIAPKTQRGQMIATNNIYNAAFIVCGVLIAGYIITSSSDLNNGIENIFTVIGFIGFVVAVVANRYILPKVAIQD